VDSELYTGGESAYLPLTNLMSAVVTDLSGRAGKLPQTSTLTLQETQPSLAVAYRLYGDAKRSDDIIARNGVRNPSFLPTGTPLKVLTA
jgi:prophage DNA circulation protein